VFGEDLVGGNPKRRMMARKRRHCRRRSEAISEKAGLRGRHSVNRIRMRPGGVDQKPSIGHYEEQDDLFRRSYAGGLGASPRL